VAIGSAIGKLVLPLRGIDPVEVDGFPAGFGENDGEPANRSSCGMPIVGRVFGRLAAGLRFGFGLAGPPTGVAGFDPARLFPELPSASPFVAADDKAPAAADIPGGNAFGIPRFDGDGFGGGGFELMGFEPGGDNPPGEEGGPPSKAGLGLVGPTDGDAPKPDPGGIPTGRDPSGKVAPALLAPKSAGLVAPAFAPPAFASGLATGLIGRGGLSPAADNPVAGKPVGGIPVGGVTRVGAASEFLPAMAGSLEDKAPSGGRMGLDNGFGLGFGLGEIGVVEASPAKELDAPVEPAPLGFGVPLIGDGVSLGGCPPDGEGSNAGAAP
jgi:hypothetical protein